MRKQDEIDLDAYEGYKSAIFSMIGSEDLRTRYGHNAYQHAKANSVPLS